MPELWDAYDSKFNKIDNVTFVREGNNPKSVIPDGMYHLVSEIIVKHADGTYLLMRRDFRKKYGGAWELTAGGSVIKGENAYEGAVRELAEETGIKSDKLKEIGRVISDIHHAAYVIYLCITDCDKDSIILQKGETIDYKWIGRDSMLDMSEDELISYRQIGLIKKYNL
jgi:8-oxo-dGTP pyrophosphatase MutT (NUDIX family)